MTQKFFNLGLPRTGTTSYSKALNLRGVFDLHFPLKYLTQLRQTERMEVYQHPTLAWQSMSHAHEHTHEYKCLPGLYPGAKFALTTRDVNSWIESFDALIAKLSPKALNGTVLDWRFRLIAGPGYKQIRDKERLRDFFLSHDEAIRTFFGNELLVLDLRNNDAHRASQLTKWLGIDGGYPHLHDRDGVSSKKDVKMIMAAKVQVTQMLAKHGYTQEISTV